MRDGLFWLGLGGLVLDQAKKREIGYCFGFGFNNFKASVCFVTKKHHKDQVCKLVKDGGLKL